MELLGDSTTQPSVVRLPDWMNNVAYYCSILATIIILCSVYLHLSNYRKPFEQHFMIRIQLIVPLFAFSCYSMLTNQTSLFNKFILEPIREVYEAFVIYTFFSLLTDMLGGERNIIILNSGREPVSHPGVLRHILPKIDMSDPYAFLAIKRGILQYVWLKPFICFANIFCEATNLMEVGDMGIKSLYLWLTIIYNCSVTLSLYSLAIFWKTLWDDLKPFKPVGKFLCVKLIIFASYWQGIILAFLNFFQVLPGIEEGQEGLLGVCIQNGLLCVELVFFAVGHFVSFSYFPYTLSQMPSARLQFKYALRDTFGCKDLIHDFRLTFYGDYYKDYKQFDSVEALISHPNSNGRMSRINQGLRYHTNGKQKHWLPNNNASNNSINSADVRSTLEIQVTAPLLGHHIVSDVTSLKSTGTSTRGLYPQSVISPPASPELPPAASSSESMSILETLKLDPMLSHIDYEKEMLDEDELYYSNACSVINNYKLDQTEIKRLINYPIVDELIDGHVFGYKVQKLRRDRLSKQNTLEESIIVAQNQSYRYGSIV